MPKSCIVCSAVASVDLQLQYCDACLSALYCSKACQRKDWKKQHKQICKLLNKGHGDMQIRTDNHTSRSIDLKEAFEINERSLDEDMKLFFKLFEESTFEGNQAAARKMKKYTKQQWPNSPLLVLLQFVDPNLPLPLPGGETMTLLHYLAEMAGPFDNSTHANQIILAKQLIEHGANVNAVSIPHGMTPLHRACYQGNVTNLDFVEYLLQKGAVPNAQDDSGRTALMFTYPDCPGAAKFLLNWPTTDVNITTRSGASVLASTRSLILYLIDKVALPDDTYRIQDQFYLMQWRGIEKILVERDAHDTGITQEGGR